MIETTTEEQQNRLSICKDCENFSIIDNQFTICKEIGSGLSLVSLNKEMICPLEKW